MIKDFKIKIASISQPKEEDTVNGSKIYGWIGYMLCYLVVY
jgi:hypothetical protein